MTDTRFNSVWDALEDTPEAAENMKVRAKLMASAQAYVQELNITQAEAADRLGITQPRLNDLLRGKINKFSLDALVNIISRAGKHVTIQVDNVA